MVCLSMNQEIKTRIMSGIAEIKYHLIGGIGSANISTFMPKKPTMKVKGTGRISL